MRLTGDVAGAFCINGDKKTILTMLVL